MEVKRGQNIPLLSALMSSEDENEIPRFLGHFFPHFLGKYPFVPKTPCVTPPAVNKKEGFVGTY